MSQQTRSGRRLRGKLGNGVAVAALALAAPAAEPAVSSSSIGKIEVGQPRFWPGAYVERSGTAAGVGPSPTMLCDTPGVACFAYSLEVAPSGDRLRVALDHRQIGNLWALELYDPNGRLVHSARTAVTAHYASSDLRSRGVLGDDTDPVGLDPSYVAEVWAHQPADGLWTVRAVGANVTNGTFRMRARLEPEDEAGPRRRLLPDLRMTPPYEFTFSSPFGAGSCRWDEKGSHCLRFSLGPENVGAGPLDLRYRSVDGVVTKGRGVQRIHYSDGSYEERHSGEFEYHLEHRHYHYAGFGLLDLYRVDDAARGRLVKVGEGPKQGYCTGPYRFVNWHSFDSDAAGSAPHDCQLRNPGEGAAIGLEAGWGDYYSWGLPGNYVEFASNGDGLYVVRVKADAVGDAVDGHVEERREDNNYAYAYLSIRGETIEVLERGYGMDPWDAAKVIADDGLPEKVGAEP